MANIKTHLNNIKNALYGKDVRSSIHDGIEAINKEVEKSINKQIDLEKTFDKLNENFEENYSPISLNFIYEKYVKRQDATIIETVGYSKYSYGEIFVKEGETFRVSGITYYDVATIIIVDNENNVIQTFPTYSPNGEFLITNEYITIPTNAHKMYINNYEGRTVIEKISSYDLKLQSYLLNDFERSYKGIDLTFEEGSYYLPSKGETIQTGGGNLYSCAINKIKVYKGEKYKFSGFSRYSCYSILITNIKGNVIAQYPTEHDTNVADYYVKDYEFVVPQDGVYILVNSCGPKQTTLFKEYGYKIKPADKFDNKNIVFDGDSITHGAGVSDHTKGILPNKNMGWVYEFQQRHKKSKCYGFAQSGWRIARKQEDSTSLLQHISSYPSNVDYFVLSGGYNDQAQNIALGTISDKYYNCDFDEYTFIGALESYFRQLVQLYPYAKKLYILTPKKVYADDSKTQRFNNYWEKIREVCDKWAIPTLDLSRVGGIVGTDTHEIIDGVNVDDLMFADTLGTGHGDYVHPNQDFYTYHLNDKVDNAISAL